MQEKKEKGGTKQEMNLQKLYDWIALQPEIVNHLNDIEKSIRLEEIEVQLRQLMNMETAPQAYQDLQNYFQKDEGNLKMLFCQLECAVRVYTKYREMDISDMIFIDTMKCFSRFIEECKTKNGRAFFDRGWWTYRQVSMNLFRIGALEYQFEEYEGEKVIGVHISSDAEFSSESVDDSLERAELFFRTYYPEYTYSKYTCDSWMMSPVLKEILPETSHIVSFQKRFRIVQENRNDKEYIEWLFAVPAGTKYEEFPEQTQLQRKAKAMLLAHKGIGSGYGVMEHKR